MTWLETRLGALATSRVSNVDKHSVEGERPVRLCNYTDVYYHDAIRDSLPFMQATASSTQVERFRLHPGDVVITKDSETADDIGIPAFVESAGEDLICGYHLAILRPTGAVVPKYLYWSLTASHVAAQWEVMATGVTRVGLKASDLKTVRLCTPPTVNEQRAIADFLDRETAKIDALIEKQNELIGLLRERRDSVVESVLDNDGAFGALGYFVDCVPGYAFSSEKFSAAEGDVRLLRGVNVKPRATDWSDTVYWPMHSAAGLARYQLETGDIVLGMDRPFISDGTRVAVIQDADLPALLLQRVLRLRARPTSSPRFLYYALMTRSFREYAIPEFTGVSVPHISDKQVRSFRLRVPDLGTQDQVTGTIEAEVAQIDSIIAKTEEFVALARERRSALITAAVTGQMDVTEGAS